jgi:hypothetical protein
VTQRKGFYFRVVQPIWILLCLAVLARTLVLRNYDAQETEFLLMLALGWPLSGLAVAVCFGVFQWSPTLAVQSLVLLWAAFFVTGWLQWFIFVPPVASKLRKIFGTQTPLSCVPNDPVEKHTPYASDERL